MARPTSRYGLMARLRREKKWMQPDTSVDAVRPGVAAFLSAQKLRITSETENVMEGQGGSALKALGVWTQKTAPYRIRVSLWQADGGVEIEATFEERTQFGKFGPVKNTTYTRLADRMLDELRGALARSTAGESASA
jgi:hypothetical protein